MPTFNLTDIARKAIELEKTMRNKVTEDNQRLYDKLVYNITWIDRLTPENEVKIDTVTSQLENLSNTLNSLSKTCPELEAVAALQGMVGRKLKEISQQKVKASQIMLQQILNNMKNEDKDKIAPPTPPKRN